MEFIKWHTQGINKDGKPIDKTMTIFGLFKFNEIDKAVYNENHIKNIIEKYNISFYEKDSEDSDNKIIIIEESEESFNDKAKEVFSNILEGGTI